MQGSLLHTISKHHADQKQVIFFLSKSQGNLALFSCQEVNLAVFIAL